MKDKISYIDFYNIFKDQWKKNKVKILKMIDKENKEFNSKYSKNGFCAERYVPRQLTIDSIISLGGVDDNTFKDYYKQSYKKIYSTIASKNYLVMLFFLRFITEEKMNQRYLDMVVYNLTIRFTSALMIKYFKYGCQNKIFNYWLNGSSGKFLLKNYDGSLIRTIDFISDDTFTKERKRVISKTEDDLIYFNIRLRTRLNSVIQNVANGYYKTLESDEMEISQSDIVNDQGEVISSQNNTHTEIMNSTEKTIEKVNYSHDDEIMMDKIIKYSGLASDEDKKDILIAFKIIKKADKQTYEIFNKFISVMYKYIDIDKPTVCSKNFPRVVLTIFNKNKEGKAVRNELSKLFKFNKNNQDSRLILRKKENSMLILMTRYFVEANCR